MFDDYDSYGDECPRCESFNTRSRPCVSFHCEDGYIDESEFDPINFAPGEAVTVCTTCRGYGYERWCSNCGLDLNQYLRVQNVIAEASNPRQRAVEIRQEFPWLAEIVSLVRSDPGEWADGLDL